MTRKEIDDAIANRLFEANLMPLSVLDRNARLLVNHVLAQIITGLVRDGKTKIARLRAPSEWRRSRPGPATTSATEVSGSRCQSAS